MSISIFALLYAILMLSVGIHEIFFSTTDNVDFVISALLTFSGSLLLFAFIWHVNGKRYDKRRRKHPK
ncbi:hypothetical protein ACQKDS_08305 [Serratia sp. NPDC078593]|uniref:hypothetical protein n=1 Tax=unclassified Serratia (in: enterobacteria) TaxID=2647522 RepID=UPI0037D51817